MSDAYINPDEAESIADLRRRVEALEKARIDLAGHIADHGNHLLRLGNQIAELASTMANTGER